MPEVPPSLPVTEPVYSDPWMANCKGNHNQIAVSEVSLAPASGTSYASSVQTLEGLTVVGFVELCMEGMDGRHGAALQCSRPNASAPPMT